jgi:CHAT domain-containing protein
MVDRSTFGFAASLGVGAIASIAWSHSAVAASHEQIVERCRESARPQVQACMMRKRVTGDRDSNLAACRESVGRPIVHACVLREEQKQAARTGAPAAPKAETAIAPTDAAAVQPVFVAPPRTITDITAILDSEKPDEAKIAERKAKADATPPAAGSPAEIAQFYYDRGNARALLGRNKEAVADGLQALAVGNNAIEYGQRWRIEQFVGLQYIAVGDPKQAFATFDAMAREGNQPGRRGGAINALLNASRALVSMGEVSRANTYAGRVEALVQEARGSPHPKWREAYALFGPAWEADADTARGLVFQARGQYADAEAAFRRSEAFRRASLQNIGKYKFPPLPEQIIEGADNALLAAARNEAWQRRLPEAEADARRALIEILDTQGKYSPATAAYITGLAAILVEQGRYQEAEKLARTALDIQRTIGIGDDEGQSVRTLSQLGGILILQRKTHEAAAVYAELDRAVAQWPPERQALFQFNNGRIITLYATGQVEAGIAVAEELVKRQTARTGANSIDTASARAVLAVGYARAGRDAEAIREFRASVPLLLTVVRENADQDDVTLVAARALRMQRVIEFYIAVLARDSSTSGDATVETFALADGVRGRAVQQALADSSARVAAKDPALAALVRNEQDIAKEISAELGALNNQLALPSGERDDGTVRAINAALEKLRADRKSARLEISRRFPSYANLIDPKTPTIDEIKATLRPGEALLSFYFGQTASFVWAVPKDGPVAFAAVPATAAELAVKVRKLREALEPQITLVSEIPPFDLALAYELYASLLKPVEAAWKPAKSLIVVTNGALGELPLSLLPTAPAEVDPQAAPLFAGYRTVPWLARTHAVTVIPSAAALVTLRHLPPGAPNREKLIGFGDPYFNAQEAAEAEASTSADQAQVAAAEPETTGTSANTVTRGAPLKRRASPHTEEADSAELAMLPRLPDTRLELLAMAKALDVDPGKSLFLGKDANEQNVETMDLSRYRIVAFATHGLVPGDIDGLTQPALALTAPDIAGVKGDGLLTMEKILALKLDADWVVLSACNTAAGAGAGAEAASGLGSAFFYAGTRALLVTNWSVQSASARELMTDLFRRQSADPKLSRGEALRQAMMALIDGPGSVDDAGRTVVTYAHPLFWAPYSVIGDGGGS